ncbi:MAG: site-specific integrase [Desulfurellales bacterium]|nr:MAG: site-specific integrase [Desulfurellales bacterium]
MTKRQPPQTPLRIAFEDYKKDRLRSASPQTLNQFNVSIDNLFEFLGRRPYISDLNRDTITDAMYWFLQRGRSAPTANKFRSNMVAIANYLFDERKIHKRLSVYKLTEPDKIPIAWNDSQLRQILQAAANAPGWIHRTPARIYWPALLRVLLYSGERVGAVLKIMPGDFDYSGLTVTIRAENRKGKKRDIIRPITRSTADYVKAITVKGREPVFYPGFGVDTLVSRLRDILKSEGLPCDRKHLFQCFRKTSATMFERHGGDATDHLDHSDRRVTKKYYLDPRGLEVKGPALVPALCLD